jgi:diguanylate cyclase (GGDEF)-like protein
MIDILTMLVLLATADVILAAALAIGIGGRSMDGLVAWTASLAARAFAFGVLASGAPAASGALALACGLVALSLTLQGSAILAFNRRSMPAWVHSAVAMAIAVPMQLLAGDVAAAIIFGALVFAALMGMLAALASQLASPGAGRARGMLVGAYLVGAGTLFSRGLASAFMADPMQALVSPGGMQSLALMLLYAVALVSTFGFLALQRDRSDAEAARLATMDPLTGTYNRRTFLEIAERELARARRANQPLSLIMVDIDHFRQINEKYGERMGDDVLLRFADVLRTALRKEDMLVRFGGDEFVVLLPEVAGPGAVVVAGRIRRFIGEDDFRVGGQRIAVTASLGVAARLDEGPESIDALIARAESALALAKERGRNRVVALNLGRSIAA